MQQHYLQHRAPGQIIARLKEGAPALENMLAEKAGCKVRISTRPAGAGRTWLEMAERNAQLGAAQALGQQATQEGRLGALQQALDLPETTQRIECFDVSHTLGEATVAACVVYDRSVLQKSDYRHYNIPVKADGSPPLDLGAVEPRVNTDGKSPPIDPGAMERTRGAVHRAAITPGDDYAALREALARRYRKIVAGEGRVPDLVLIDGGKGQLAVAAEVFAELGMSDVALVAVAKGAERRPGREQLLPAGSAVALELGPDHPGLHLVQQIRDEAHRFAIQGHRARRGKTRKSSSLEAIRGIGAKRRHSLLSRFGGLRELLAASVDELAQVEGISRALAQRIYDELH